MRIDAATLRQMWPHAPEPLVEAAARQSSYVFNKYGLTTTKRVAHFMAQISHESGGGTITRENMQGYTAVRITQVWPTRFHSVTEAQPYAHNARALADKVYNGRMGNKPGTDDGYNYRGAGLLQITGRDSYREIGGLTGLPLEQNPDLAASPNCELEIAACEFKKLGCLPYCDADNINAVTHHVNGGYIGLASRKAWLAKWKTVRFAEDEAPAPEPEAVPLPEPAPQDEPPPVEIPRGSDDHLPPPETPIRQDKGLWAKILGVLAGAGTLVGNAVDSIRPLVSDPRTITVAALVLMFVGAVILYEKRKRVSAANA